eukprot:scaffold1954_cov268-Pinguiococcus_pyrenoidosus.AAC.247
MALRHHKTGEGPKQLEIDEDLPGQGQFYCRPCARHFISKAVYLAHCKSRPHKRRLKDIAQKQYTQAEADLGAGMTREVLPSARELRGQVAAGGETMDTADGA